MVNSKATVNSFVIQLNYLGRKTKRRFPAFLRGEYVIRKRYSRKYNWHLEVVDVPSRKGILLHPANNAQSELKGCIAPVSKLSGAGLGLMSRKAFVRLKKLVDKALDNREKVKLIIQS